MNKRAPLIEAFIYAIEQTVNNLGLYFLSILTTIGIVMTSSIILIGSYVLILARQSPPFQDLLRMFFAGQAVTVVQGKVVATEQAMQMTKMILATFSPLMIILGISLFILFGSVIAAIMAGHIHMLLILRDSGKASMSDFFAAFSLAPGLYAINFLAAITAAIPPILISFPAFLLGLPMALRIWAFIIGGIGSIFLWARLYFGQYFFIDKNKTILGPLRASWQVTENNLFSMILIVIISCILSANTTLTLFTLFPFVLMVVAFYRSLVPAEADMHQSEE